ncbi:pyridoxine 5'-phosphate synthase [Dissulfurimicrobium hydrothermale]|uniref:pyridoxine 5'-phosphate synthase n=1 Tax=Dissulfurimicrobium hydrothermale TaxID=1750598 RepID=UPI001EDA30F6|nr:pyridoxine 5'-phosphate synthase [Dissulfurimicrobium hydrothermale]UKL13254.1 pyridoxine 5'-phosphate synthase [Dissulfurimicrobium hydrothermale]
MAVLIRIEHDNANGFNLVLIKRSLSILMRGIGKKDAELSILLTGDKGIIAINKEWFDRSWPTNVISFGQADGAAAQHQVGLMGDIVVSIDAAAREAVEMGVSLDERLIDLLIHGLAHILGEDHELGEAHAERMRNKERELRDILIKEKRMADLCINIDHIATIREARGITEPDPIMAAGIVELAGADGVVVHLREDRRHIKDRDVRILREVIKTRLTLEMAATDEMIGIASEIKPDIVTLVPEKRQELTTEGGLDVVRLEDDLERAVSRLHDANIPVSLFIEPEKRQIEAAQRTRAECVEIHTGRYADAPDHETEEREFERIANAARFAYDVGLRVHAGHGLNYRNTARLCQLSEIAEFSIGHSIIARAVLVGLEKAVKEMLSIVKRGHLA